MKKNQGDHRENRSGKKGRFEKSSGRSDKDFGKSKKSGHGESRPKGSSHKGRDFDRKKSHGDQKEAFSPLKKYGKNKPSHWEDKPEEEKEKTVYKGRNKSEKPIFEKKAWDEGEKKSEFKKSRFKKPFFQKKSSKTPKPEYNFKKIQKSRGQHPGQEELRLNKYIANAGICSRREADKLIEKGEIKVNGEIITELGHKVHRYDKVVFKGKPINPEKPVYVLLNKPKDFITTTDDPMDRKTVMHLVQNACEERIFPVGRLDRNTTGLLLFTNDGELAANLSHPSSKIKKIYQVTLDKPISKGDVEAIIEGLTLEDGLVEVDDIQVLSKDKTILGIEIHVGKNRIVRRIFAHLGYEVTALDRVTYAGLTKKEISRGKWRFLSEKEVINLKFFK
ncbi:pseudouridine synthase [Echinicola jeungdonensis]|uniref:Pseudouridine synthase n=1 Tax=Echinicola jeungdonensis TaxID=709343 RepID=A0ABV5J6C5_9BACT|nr:pseudouridine synthase [Echinicola jeungdonensis]MDN3668731.1 pseudouridine synthase [Echinicola jeungdonensis]